jgi:hypothetical protein
MKIKSSLATHFSIASLICAGGCGIPQTHDEPLGGGYEEVTYTRSFISEPQAHRITLQYRNPDGGRVVIWPSMNGPIVKGDLAVFVANMGYEQPTPDHPHVTSTRLFAVKAPEPPLDITGEVLWRWSKQSGENFAKAFGGADIVRVEEKSNAFVLHFARGIDPDLNIDSDWNQLADIMREVKEKGIVRTDPVWGTAYAEKRFEQ